MSIMFKQYDAPNPIAAVQPPPDLDRAVEEVVKGAESHYVSCFLMTGAEDASKFRDECRSLEAGLLTEIAGNKITTQTAATEYLVEKGRKDFPAAKFLSLLKVKVGTEVKPATWAEVVTAVKAEPQVEPVVG
jgi:hypothetical protein